MKTIIFIVVILTTTFKVFGQEYEQFRLDFNSYTIFDNTKMEWGDWIKGESTFVINVNGHGDVKYFPAGKTETLLKKISNVENDVNEKGAKYQVITVLDEVGNKFFFSIYEDPKIGVMLIDSDGEHGLQFSNTKN